MSAPFLAIDFRSLRLFRSALGALLLFDLFFRARDFTSFFTEVGALPASLVENKLSLFLLSNSPFWAGFLFISLAVCAVFLIGDRQVRLASLLAFALALSLRNRNPFIGYGGDDLLRLGLLWSAFLPAGPRKSGEIAFSGASALSVFLQISVIYFCAGMHKDALAWWHDGRAAFMALSGGTYSRPQAALLLQFPAFLHVASAGVFLLERFGWLLFFMPERSGWFRLVGCLLFAAMHLSFGLFMYIELFPLIDTAFLLLILPTGLWEKLKLSPLPNTVSPFRFEPVIASVALALSVTVAAFSISRIPQVDRQLPKPVRQIVHVLGLDQKWSMFSPVDRVSDGYHRLIATAPDGRKVDLLNNREIAVLPPAPANVQNEQRGFRWTRYLDNLMVERHADVQRQLLAYLCRSRSGWRADWYYFSETTVLVPGLRNLQDSALVQSQYCP